MLFDYKMIFENIKTAVFVADTGTGEILECNRAAEEMIDRSRDEIIGMHQTKLHPAEEEEKYRNMFREHVEKGGKMQSEAEAFRKDGSRVPVVISVRVVKMGHKKIIIGVFTDITEQQRIVEHLRKSEYEKSLVLDNVSEIIAHHDKEHNLVWANKAYLDALGLPLEEVKGKKCYHNWGLDRACMECPVTGAIETGTSRCAELTPKNQPHWPENQGSWKVSAAPVRDPSGNIVGAIEIAHDITGQKKSEEELMEKIDELERFHRGVVGREEKMIEFKEKIAGLEEKLKGKS